MFRNGLRELDVYINLKKASFQYNTIDSTTNRWVGSAAIGTLTSEPDVSKYFNPKTGVFNTYGGLYSVSVTSDAKKEPKTSFYVKNSGGQYYLWRGQILGFTSGTNLDIHVEYTQWLLSAKETRTKTGTGTEVKSTSISTYPRNGLSGLYWYDYSGIK